MTREGFQLRHKVGVGQVPHVKQQFQITGIAKFMSKAQHLNPHWSTLAIGTESLQEVTAERVYGVFGAINNLIGLGADARHGGAFGAYCLEQALSVVGRVRAAGLAKAML